jgi:hypothetical protein
MCCVSSISLCTYGRGGMRFAQINGGMTDRINGALATYVSRTFPSLPLAYGPSMDRHIRHTQYIYIYIYVYTLCVTYIDSQQQARRTVLMRSAAVIACSSGKMVKIQSGENP